MYKKAYKHFFALFKINSKVKKMKKMDKSKLIPLYQRKKLIQFVWNIFKLINKSCIELKKIKLLENTSLI